MALRIVAPLTSCDSPPPPWPARQPHKRLNCGPYSLYLPKYATPLPLSLHDGSFSTFTRTRWMFSPEVPTPLALAPSSPAIVYSSRDHTVLCIAHPLGRGTFFYVSLGEYFFASTALSDVAMLLDELTLDKTTVADYLGLGRRFPLDKSQTFLAGIRQVPPGSFLRLTAERSTILPYWTPDSDEVCEQFSFSQALEHLQVVLDEVIQTKLAPPRIGCLTSGGIDSAVVAAAVKRQATNAGVELTLLTVGHGLDCPEERRQQTRLAEHLQLRLTTIPDLCPKLQLEPLRCLNRDADAPAGGIFTGIYSEVVQAASAMGLAALFGGEGGDELFAPSPTLIADFLRAGRLVKALEASAYFAAVNGDEHALGAFWRNGPALLLPSTGPSLGSQTFMTSSRASEQHRLFLCEMFGPFHYEIELARARLFQALRQRVRRGEFLTRHNQYDQAIEIPFYEPTAASEAESFVTIMNPLAEWQVVRAAMSLKLEERITSRVGFRPKRLLAALAANVGVPDSICRQPKIGVANLLARVTPNDGEEAGSIITSAGLDSIGIRPSLDVRLPSGVPASFSLYWSLLLVLAVWWTEMQCSWRSIGGSRAYALYSNI